MKAIVYTQYGAPEVLHAQEVAKPTPKDNEVLVRVHATTVNYGDLLARNFKNTSPAEFNMLFLFWLLARLEFGLNAPKKNILGSEFAGEIAAVGSAVTRFKTGDQVFGYRGQNMGAYAEYLCMSENGLLTHKPSNMTYAEAATVPYGAIMALNLLRTVNLQRGQKILINGASGSIGSFAVQLAKAHFGATVTGVCSTPRLAWVKALGADQVIDYTREDFTQNGETYDLIFDVLGRGSFARYQNSLTPNGRYLLASFKLRHLLEMLWTSLAGQRKVICAISSEKVADLVFIKELIEAGQIKTVIDKHYALEHAAAAHRYVEQGHKKGNIVLTLAPAND